MDTLASDIEFQHNAETLRIAPWLDMAKLRSSMQQVLLEKIENGEYNWAYEEYREDILKFCNGECNRIARASEPLNLLGDILFSNFPAYRTDSKRRRSHNHISRYLFQIGLWTKGQRVDVPKDIPF